METTYYQVLNVTPDATPQQIKDAYRELVKEYHPDKNPSEKASQLIVIINEAYEILSDPLKKAQYDQQLFGIETPYEEQISEQEAYREAYRMEYIRRKNREAKQKKENRESIKKWIYSFMQVVHFFLAIWALTLIIDFLMPRNTYEEYAIQGWQQKTRSRSISFLRSYIQTPTFVMQVPHELHLNYNYYDEKQLLTIRASGMFDIPLTVAVHERHHVLDYDVLGTLYKAGLLLPLLLLINTGYVVYTKYGMLSYMFSFTPMFIIYFMLM